MYDKAGFDSVNAATTSRLFGLFNESHMQYETDRGNDVAGEPSLSEMTAKADILDNNDKGYLLVVEAAALTTPTMPVMRPALWRIPLNWPMR